jgi:Fe2+ or Zn2+ uptake regulation protein
VRAPKEVRLATASCLREHGIAPSHQRVRILEYLRGTIAHPTVDSIFRDLGRELPTLSKTTVYSTLSLLCEQGLAQVITIEENECRYDADTSEHGHFKCRVCGTVYDFRPGTRGKAPELPAGFLVEQCHVYCRGVCARCPQ